MAAAATTRGPSTSRTSTPTRTTPSSPIKAGLFGGDGDDEVHGGGGDDDIHGGNGDDMLWGDGGADQFFFDTALNAGRATSTRSPTSAAAMATRSSSRRRSSTRSAAASSKNEFVLGGKAKDGNDHLLFNQKKGYVAYDEDGKGGTGKVVFATVEKGMSLAHTDFDMV